MCNLRVSSFIFKVQAYKCVRTRDKLIKTNVLMISKRMPECLLCKCIIHPFGLVHIKDQWNVCHIIYHDLYNTAA